jgi:hypothetical protein
MKIRHLVLFLLALAFLTLPRVKAQSPPDSKDASQTNAIYAPPTQKTKFHHYLFDTFGPYPIVGAAFAAGINQATRTPPEWQQGFEGYGQRVGSAFGIAMVSTTTRYVLAQALQEDTLYYRCQCKGFFPRLGHAVVSTFTSRRGEDGHRAFSFPALVAPYAGTMTAVYAWYPGRYNASDGFRMGNYTLLGYAGQNLALEFVFSRPHSLLSRIHKHGHRAPDDQANPDQK